jgi:hypothetical protein
LERLVTAAAIRGRTPARPISVALSLIVGLAWLAGPVPPVAAATVAYGTPTASATFDQGIEFRQPVTVTGSIRRAELLVEYPRAPGPEVRVVLAGPTPTVLRYTLDTADGGLLPNTPVTARWRLVSDDGSVSLGPAVSTRYLDTRFAWQTRQAGILRVHWYAGGSELGNRALEIGMRAVESATRLLGVSETEPLDFYIYGSQDAFYDALGPGTRENVGGQANAEIRTLFALITPGDISLPWVETVIPHELTHLVFDTAVRNPYHFPPRWLNEGLAVYLASGYGATDRAQVERAAADGSLMPLTAIADQFPTTRARFSLAYAESVAAVDHLVRSSGDPALVRLVRSYASGVTDDEAFRAALGQDVAAFDAGWRASLRAREPVVHGPRPDPAGPLPAGWSAGAGATPGPAAGAGVKTGGDASGATLLAGVAVILGGLVLLGVLLLRPRSASRPDPGGGPR